jgi:predicted acylesterase/phospholipase RssA
MAHIGVIKMVDSLGIVPDIVVGTSIDAASGPRSACHINEAAPLEIQ